MNDYYKSLESFRKTFESKSDSELASLGLFHSLIELKDYDAVFSEMNRFMKYNIPNHYKITLAEIYEQLDDDSEEQFKDIVTKYYNLYCKTK